MTIIGLLVLFIVVGVLLWLINTYVPMQPQVKNLMNIAVIIALVLYLLQAFGVFGLGMLNTPIHQVR